MSGQSHSKEQHGVIDENLRRVYQEAVDEGVPDRFKSLLDQLKQQDEEQGKRE
ncbi:regulator [Sulfitobacter sp. S223]|uniref:NepR family anti-sigma factor n=1 Tax=Sulfitobacter sp. S223 TaxID=2867023 RepID=UPI0021A6D15C|nr:NepR family anti-sigma factor [Sulfitobacter sp. S223]UWR26645.1 regulator [Sulfitobacter sp. S223]